jgi:hypothetical protein
MLEDVESHPDWLAEDGPTLVFDRGREPATFLACPPEILLDRDTGTVRMPAR